MAQKILIVDDDPDIIAYLEDVFSDEGYATVSARNGRQALTAIESECPDAITLDLEMPNEWGPRFYRKYSQKEEFKNIPVIVISGLDGHDQSIRKAVAAIRKPFEPEAVLVAVKKALGE